jgi:predicted DNA-binding helix-hairpin-helix protein
MGQRTVKRLLQVRRHHRVTLRDLGRLGASIKKARPFVVATDSTAPARLLDRVDLAARVKPPRQMTLFEAAASAGNGEL